MKTMKNYIENGTDDRKLSLISKLVGEKPEDAKYCMIMPQSRKDMSNMGCSAALKYFHEVLDRRSLVFSIINCETGKTAATIVCRINLDDYSYTYTLKSFEEETKDLADFEKECVVFAVQNLMRNKRIHSAEHNVAHQAYNTLGCAAIQA